MDSASRLILKQNEKLIKNLDMKKLYPFLEKSKIFTNSMLLDLYDPVSEADLFTELPTRGPHAFSHFLEVLEIAGYGLEANKLRNSPKYVETYKVKSVYYSMDSKPLGYCFIINNVIFDNLSVREGSDVDAKELQLLFEKMGFVVKVEHNLKGKEMKMYLKNFAKSEVLKTVCCCFVIILSHGDKNSVVYGTDSYALQKDEIHKIFNNIHCQNLRNKPKVFLYQACRGSDEDHGTESADSPSEIDTVTESSDAKAEIIIDTTDAVPFKKHDSSIAKKDPSINDILIIHSSLPDHKAYRDHYHGSWLIQDVVSVFSKDHLEQDLENMLKTVSRNIQQRLSLKGQKKQVPHTENIGFRALLHLCSNDDYKGCDINSRDYLSLNPSTG